MHLGPKKSFLSTNLEEVEVSNTIQFAIFMTHPADVEGGMAGERSCS